MARKLGGNTGIFSIPKNIVGPRKTGHRAVGQSKKRRKVQTPKTVDPMGPYIIGFGLPQSMWGN